MKYDFDYVERKNTNSMKWSIAGMLNMVEYADDESLPLWVADMDFKTVPLAIKNLSDRMLNGVYGYTIPSEDYYDAVKYWHTGHYNWDLKKEWIVATQGVVPTVSYIINALTEKGDGVIIQEPVYYPFKSKIESAKRVAINNNLIEKNGDYTIDFDDLESKAKDKNTKLMIFCHPHNPVGRIWTKEELTKVAQICYDNNVVFCSDEIHSDLILFGNEFISAGLLDDKLLSNTIVCTAPNKTFNLAGLAVSNMIVINDELRTTLLQFMDSISVNGKPNMIGQVALTSVYTEEGEEWLKEVISLIEDNYNFMKSYVEQNIPNVKMHKHQGTYLVWLDFRETSFSWEEVEKKMSTEAKVVLDPGSKFGELGRGFMRMNIACHRTTLTEALERIKKIYS